MRKLINKLISKTKNEQYEVDSNIPTGTLIGVLFSKFIQLLRGHFVRGHFKKGHKGKRVFVGKKVTIKCKNKISCGRGVTFGDYTYIDALSKDGIVIGNNVSFGRNCQIECTGVLKELGEGLIIEDNVGIASNVFISVRGKVHIGKDTIIGPNVRIFSENHNFGDKNLPIRLQGTNRKGVVIGQNCWIGSGVTILDGVTIGEGCVIAAGAVITKDVAPNSVVGGVPAKFIKNVCEG